MCAGYRVLARYPDACGARCPTGDRTDGCCGGWGYPGVGRTIPPPHGRFGVELVLWVAAAILVVAGVAAVFRSQVVWGALLIVAALLVGPGGVSLFT